VYVVEGRFDDDFHLFSLERGRRRFVRIQFASDLMPGNVSASLLGSDVMSNLYIQPELLHRRQGLHVFLSG